MNGGEITYRQQRKYCGKARCRKCRDGIGHGPYWFAFQTVDGKTVQTYIGKDLPPDATRVSISETAPEIVQTPSSSTQQVGRMHHRPLIGRETEQQTLRSLLLDIEQYTHRPSARPGKDASSHPMQQLAQCVLLQGEAGIGKTRLAEEIGRVAEQRGWMVVWGRSYPQESAIPYFPWIEVLRKVVSQATKKMLTSQSLALQPLVTLLPELREQLLAPPPLLFAEQEHHHIAEAVYLLLTLMSERTPLLVILDDVQWADESSGKLLAYLARRLKEHPLLLMGTYREHELPPDHPLHAHLTDLHLARVVLPLTLSPLSSDEISAMLAALPRLPEAVVQQIQARAAGNPFFAEELAHSLVPGDKIDTAAPLPGTIAATLDRRIGQLSQACQRLLGKAAVLGTSFELSFIEAISSLDEDTILDLLEEALQAGVLTEEEEAGTRITYQFWHPLLATHLYEGASAARRAHLHRQAAAVFRRIFEGHEEDGAATMTYHLVRGGASEEQIAHYAELAGDRAYQLSAYIEAEHFYRIAVAQLKTAGGAAPQTGASPGERQRLAYLFERLGECAMIQGNSQEARERYLQVLEMLASEPSQTSSEKEGRGGAQIQALLWREVGLASRYLGDHEQARTCCERGEHLLRTAGITAGPAWASLRYQESSLYWQEGNYQGAQRVAQDALALFEAAMPSPGAVMNTTHLTRTQRTLQGDPVDLGRVHALLGALAIAVSQMSDAIIHLRTALSIFEQHQCRRELSVVSCNLADVYLRTADFHQARLLLGSAREIAESTGDNPSVCVIYGNLGIIAAQAGDLAGAEAWYRRSRALADRIDDPVYICLWDTYLARVLSEQGRLPEARACLAKALSLGRARHIAPCVGFSLVSLGIMRIAQALARTDDGQESQRVQELGRARNTLQRALVLEELEMDARIEGRLALAHVSFLLNDQETAKDQASFAWREAQQYHLSWLAARAQRIRGSILAAEGEHQQARAAIEEALRIFHEASMRLEYARTLSSYGALLLSSPFQETEVSARQGLSYLEEARQAFITCNALLDLQQVEHLLTSSAPSI